MECVHTFFLCDAVAAPFVAAGVQVLLHPFADRDILNLHLVTEFGGIARRRTGQGGFGQVKIKDGQRSFGFERKDDIQGNIIRITVEHPVGKRPEIVSCQVGTSFVVPARRDVAGLSSANRTPLANVPFIRLNQVRPIIQLAIECRMHAGQVISLKIVVDVGFPIALHVVATTFEELHRGEVEFLGLHFHAAEGLVEGLSIRIQIDENQIEPFLNSDRGEGKLVGIESEDTVKFGGIHQASVEPIGPPVICTAEQLSGTAPFGRGTGPVTANVIEATQVSVLASY